MSVIENFVALSKQEQEEFAATLIKTINSENVFSSEITFAVDKVEADDITGDLLIEVTHSPLLEVSRKATWQAADEDSAEEDPSYDAEYDEPLYADAENTLKTTIAEINGYRVDLEVVDADEENFVGVEIDHISHEDDGIGSYEYWGMTGYDSSPYVEVTGKVIQECTCAITLSVTPKNTFEAPAEETPETELEVPAEEIK